MIKRKFYITAAAMMASLAMGAGIADAALQAVGPTNPAITIPTFYQDANGMALGPCLDQNTLCVLTPEFDPLLLASPPPITTTGPINDANFPAEIFYFLADSKMQVNGDLAVLRLALEAAFLSPVPPVVVPNQAVTFLRINFKKMTGLPALGHYTVTHPYGTFTFDTDANGDTVLGLAGQGFRTEDPLLVKIPGAFADLLPATTTQIGPFLQSATGPVTDPLTGIRYIGDPKLTTAVTGGINGNVFTINGPDIGGVGVNTVSTPLFSLAGRIMGLDIAPKTPASFGVWKTGATSTPLTYTITNLTGAPAGPLTVTPPAGFALAAGDTCNTATLTQTGVGSTCTLSLVFAPVADGAASGNVTIAATGVPTASIPVSGTGDGVAPALAITTISRITPQATQTISGTVTDANGIGSVQVTVNGGAPQAATVSNGTWSFNIAAGLNPNASNTISVVAGDSAQPAPGNTTTANDTITLDSINPAVAIDAVPATVNTESQQIAGTASDTNGISSLGVKLNGTLLGLATVNAGTWTFNIPALVPNLPSSITATATDGAGNQTTSAAAPITFAVPVDGDMDLSGQVDIGDALFALRSSVNLVTPTAIQKAHGNCAPLGGNGLPNPDANLDISDALLILRKVVGLVTSF